jgi:hypothetical protein
MKKMIGAAVCALMMIAAGGSAMRCSMRTTSSKLPASRMTTGRWSS